MAWPKSQSKTAKDYPDKKIAEFRIIDGKPTKVYVQGKHVLGPIEDSKPQVLAPISQLEDKPKSEQKEKIPASSKTPISETPAPASMPAPLSTGEKAGTGLQLIPQDEVAGIGGIEGPKAETSNTDNVDCPHCKSKNVDILLDLEKARRYKCKDCDETFAINKPIEENKEKAGISKEGDTKADMTAPKVEEVVKAEIVVPKAEIVVPKAEIVVPKAEVTTPKVEIVVPKAEVTTPKVEIVVPKAEVTTPKVEKVTKSETSTSAYTKAGVDIEKQERQISTMTKVLDTPKVDTIPRIEIQVPNINIPNKADEVKSQAKTEVKPQPKVEKKIEKKIDKRPIKEVKYMADEETGYQQPQPNVVKQLEDLLNKKKISRQEFDELMAEKKFNESIVQAAKFAEETREQIPQISEKIEGISTEIKDVEGRLGTVNNSVDVLCTGVDCIKTDVKKFQETYETLQKQMDQRFRELEEKVQDLKQPSFVCDSCGEDKIRPLDSYCANCGSPIHEWNDDTGQSVKGWIPYWKRMGRTEP